MVCLRVVCKYARIALYVTMDPGRLGLGMAAMRNTVCSMVEGFVNFTAKIEILAPGSMPMIRAGLLLWDRAVLGTAKYTGE